MDRILDGTVTDHRLARTSVKWAAYGPDVIPMWVAEMDAAPVPAVVRAVTEAVRRGDTGYAVDGRYARAFADFAAWAWGWQVDPELTMGVADVMIGVEIVLRQVVSPSGVVVVSSPCYDSFYGFVATTGRGLVDAPLTAAGRLDVVGLESAFAGARAQGRDAAYLLCNPQNPTGTVHTGAELRALAELAHAYDVTVVADEIHAPLVYPDSTPFTPWLTVARSGFVVTSASKAWNLAGFKAALVVAGEQSADTLRRIDRVHTHGVGHIGEIAHIAAYREGREWLAQLLTELDDNRRWLRATLPASVPGVRVHPGEATYLAWLDARSVGLGDDPATWWRHHAGVALASGTNYAPSSGRGLARLNFATSPTILRAAVDALAAATADRANP